MEIITKTITKAELWMTGKGDTAIRITLDNGKFLFIATTQVIALNSLLSLLVGQEIKVEQREVQYKGTEREVYLMMIDQSKDK